ncbi:MAG: hypothetical protein ACREP5_05000 [Candidatus Binatia bacterium]
MFKSELQIGIAYTLLAGALWGIGPLLLKAAIYFGVNSVALTLSRARG